MLSSADRIALRNCHLSGLALGYSQWSLFVVIATIVWFGGLEVQAGRAGFEEMLKAFLSVVFAAIGVAQAAVSGQRGCGRAPPSNLGTQNAAMLGGVPPAKTEVDVSWGHVQHKLGNELGNCTPWVV